MKYVVPSFIVAGLVAIASGLYVTGIAFLVLIVLFYGAVFFVMLDLSEFYFRIPTVWQDISQTLAAAKTSWFLNHGVNFGAVVGLYWMMRVFGSLFEISINERVVDAFERKYADVCILNAQQHLPKLRALHYFVKSIEKNPERLPEIVEAIMVRKKVGGKKVEGKASMFFKMAFG